MVGRYESLTIYLEFVITCNYQQSTEIKDKSTLFIINVKLGTFIINIK